jgi:hypothetical protein
MLTETQPIIEPIAQFGVAGFMGMMWLWERHTSRKREEQIDDAHARIVGDRVQLDQLIAVVRGNAEAMTRLATTQEQLINELRKHVQR